MLSSLLLFSAAGLLVSGRSPYAFYERALPEHFDADNAQIAFSLNVSSCPGYTLTSMEYTQTGLTAQLNLAGPACNAFGIDIANLTLEVTYDSSTRLHVNIFDTAKKQFIIPSSAVSLTPPSNNGHENTADLAFNYDPSPFAFWITRRSNPDAQPLFDTRISSLPPTPIPAFNVSDRLTAFDGFPLVFEDAYLQMTSALPKGTNVYGLGEIVASSGFRRDVGTNGGVGTIQTMWARDSADALDENIFGSHSIYLEHRFDETTNHSQSHGVFLFNAAGSDIFLQTPPSSNVSLIEYRVLGGTLDLYFFSGPSPQSVVEQYGQLIGFPTWQPAWAFGFHLCRWGYETINDTKEVVRKMREANIPLEVQWTDIDLLYAQRDFTADPVSFPPNEMRAFTQELAVNNQHYIPIVDSGIAHQSNSSDNYAPYLRGVALDVFVKNPDGSEFIGQQWPGYTVFPDWFAPNTTEWWTEALLNWTELGVGFSGIWLDESEASSFCTGSCGTGANWSNTDVGKIFPGQPGNLVTSYPEGYNASISGPSGNVTVNGSITYGTGTASPRARGITKRKRGLGAANETDIDLAAPPYAIHNANSQLGFDSLSTNATHFGGYVELDTHNLFGHMEAKATHLGLQTVFPHKRPFIIARSTFPGSGRWAGHWLGDNASLWKYMYLSIQGVLQFQIFQIPMVGADTCGFDGNTDEELCNRWMQLSAFMPFYRNHNEKGAIPQEPYVWASVANASRIAIGIRYQLLPYWYTLFANASQFGSPPIRALFYEFPDEPELFAVDRQFLVGRDILVTPVLTPNVSAVDGIFPGRGNAIWRDWYTHDVVNTAAGKNTTLSAPLGHINVHVRDGAAILLHSEPGYTITETLAGPYNLLVSLSADGQAFGTAYLDDGETIPPTPNRTLEFRAKAGTLQISSAGTFNVSPKLENVTVLGVLKPTEVKVNGRLVRSWEYSSTQEKLVVGLALGLDLNDNAEILWA